MEVDKSRRRGLDVGLVFDFCVALGCLDTGISACNVVSIVRSQPAYWRRLRLSITAT